MEPEDIYSKEQPPLFARRRPPTSSGDKPQNPFVSARIGPPVERVDERRRHRRRQRERPGANWSLLLWGALAVVVLLYLGVLGFMIRHHNKAPATAPSADSTAAKAPPAAPEKKPAEEPATDIAARIRNWKAAGDGVDAAVVLQHTGKFDEAAERLEIALKSDDRHVDALSQLANVYLQQRKLKDAELSLLRVLDSDPTRDVAQLMLANVYALQRQPAASLAVALWILETDPYSLEAHTVAAQAYAALDQPAQAIDHWKKVLTVQRDNVQALNSLAIAYTQIGRNKDAIETLKKVLEMDSKNSASYYNLAVCYARQDQPDAALGILGDAAVKFGNSFVQSWTQASDFEPIRTNAAFQEFGRLLAEAPAQGQPLAVPLEPAKELSTSAVEAVGSTNATQAIVTP